MPLLSTRAHRAMVRITVVVLALAALSLPGAVAPRERRQWWRRRGQR